MANVPWTTILEIIAYILKIIAGGTGTSQAIGMAANKFGYTESEIRNIWNNR